MVDSFLIESYGGALFKTFTRKDSYSENSQDKKICRESSIWATQPKTLWFLLIRFSLFSLILLASGVPGMTGSEGTVRGVRTHPLRILSALFSNVKCLFLPIIPF